MKDSSKETLNELIRRERESEVGETIPDSRIKNMIEDIEHHVWWSNWGIFIGTFAGVLAGWSIENWLS